MIRNIQNSFVLNINSLPKEIRLWIYPRNLPLINITKEEMKWKDKLSNHSYENFCFTRGYLRQALSEVLNIESHKIPLIAEPGKAPFLKNNNGYISISHSDNKVFFAWAPSNIGIDIEKNDRIFQAKKIMEKYYHPREKKYLRKATPSSFQKEVLKYWIIKEAAYKWQHKKETTDFFQWEWIKESKIAIHYKKDLKVDTYFQHLDNYFLGIAYKS